MVVLPHGLLGTRADEEEQSRAPAHQQSPDPLSRQPVAALATPVPATAPAWPPGSAASPPKVLMSIDSYDARQNASPGAEEPARGAPASAPSAASPGPARPGSADPGARPPLPQRTGQTHLVPQLAQPAAAQWEEPTGDHDPQSMATYREGFSQADETSADEGNGVRGRTDDIS